MDTLESLPVFQESQICVENTYNSSLDGIYKWLYYDINVGGSIYYNIEKNMYIKPYINTTKGNYEYHIYGNDQNVTVHAKCDGAKHSPLSSRCTSHSQCTLPYRLNTFCLNQDDGYGECGGCKECHYCHDGIDGTCGTCDSNLDLMNIMIMTYHHH